MGCGRADGGRTCASSRATRSKGALPATRGDALARAYVAARFEAIGLEPGAPGGAFEQAVPLVGVTSHAPRELRVTRGGDAVALRLVPGLRRLEQHARAFVARRRRGDRLRRLRHRRSRVRVGRLQGRGPARQAAARHEQRPVAGPGALRRQQAPPLRALGLQATRSRPRGRRRSDPDPHDASAGYSWSVVQSSWSGEQLPSPRRPVTELPVKAWATEEACRRIARLAGQDLEALREAAESRDFRPVPLGSATSLALRNDVPRRESANVIGRLRGSDPALAREAVLFTAHHDHYGIEARRAGRGRRSTTARSTTPRASPRCSRWPRPSRRCPSGRGARSCSPP